MLDEVEHAAREHIEALLLTRTGRSWEVTFRAKGKALRACNCESRARVVKHLMDHFTRHRFLQLRRGICPYSGLWWQSLGGQQVVK